MVASPRQRFLSVWLPPPPHTRQEQGPQFASVTPRSAQASSENPLKHSPDEWHAHPGAECLPNKRDFPSHPCAPTAGALTTRAPASVPMKPLCTSVHHPMATPPLDSDGAMFTTERGH